MRDAVRDYSKIWTPQWKQQIFIMIMAFLIALVGMLAALSGHRILFYVLFGIAVVISVYRLSKLRCPACGCYVCMNTKARGYHASFGVIPFDKTCPQCGVILRK